MNTNNQRKPRSRVPVSKKISFCAVMSALSIVILLFGSLFQSFDITTAAFASFIVIIVMLEMGGCYPYLLYLSTSTLSFLLLPNKTVAFMYICFFGLYPIAKKYLERLPRIYSWIAKFVVFNLIIGAFYLLMKTMFSPEIVQVKIPLILLLNVIFLTLDFAQTLFITAYVRKFRRLLQIYRFFRQ